MDPNVAGAFVDLAKGNRADAQTVADGPVAVHEWGR